ncbi:MAG: hypothetical protein J5J06_07370 [Phycisphaerae bacterium]|nr:hypothetical protein [Phycisphaerae bacterium]
MQRATALETISHNIASDDRRCLACGYMLRGLGPEPRCPECGLINIPEEFRRQVWDLVDSGRWFFSGFFRPFRKRPPGWWWALDRPGDVRHSWEHAAANVLISLLIIAAVVGVADGWCYRVNDYGLLSLPVGEPGPPEPLHLSISVVSLTHSRRMADWCKWRAFDSFSDDQNLLFSFTYVAWVWSPSWQSALPVMPLVAWVWLVWVFPAFAGVSTQIRKDLPAFARAPRTIVAAANYESHRMIYLAIVVSASAVLSAWIIASVDIASQTLGGFAPASFPKYAIVAPILPVLLLLFAAFNWIGPLRSDYTRQLIQGRWHAARIILMYVLFFPAAFVLGSISSIGALMRW